MRWAALTALALGVALGVRSRRHRARRLTVVPTGYATGRADLQHTWKDPR